MKKTFMFVGLAMCATVAFAQTESLSRTAKASIQHALRSAGNVVEAPVDYKASIFTKEEGADTMRCFTFGPTDMQSVTTGTLGEDDIVNDTATAGMAHTVPLTKDLWYHYDDSANFVEHFASDYPETRNFVNAIIARVGTANNPGMPDDGFMFISLSEQTNRAGNFNAYFELPAISNTNPNGNTHLMVEVRLTQAYAKYYDRCYIDYQINGKWYAREINVEGVDVDINTFAGYHPSFTMPTELMNESNVKLRLRSISWRRGSAYGYFWAVDNVAIMSVTREDRWVLSGARAFDGFYGTMPQGMEIPMTFGVAVSNSGVANLNNAALTVAAGTNSGNFATVATGTPKNLPSGNINASYTLSINERGFMYADSAVDNYMNGWLENFENYGNTTGNLIGGYRGRSLPTRHVGQNFYAITASATNNRNSGTLTTNFDTVLYTVSDFLEQPQSGRIEGFRWGVDNGVIASGSIFCPQLTDAGYIANDTADNHYTTAGYFMHMRYVSGNTVPTNWRFRGIEIVPQTAYDTARMRGTTIVPLIFKEVYSGDGYLRYQSVPCGIDNQAFRVGGSESNQLETGYIMPETDYNAINIFFPDQPAIEPNTAYRFGYSLNSDAFFAPAGQETRFVSVDDTGALVWTNYSSDPNLSAYARQNMAPATPYHIYCYDPVASSGVYGHMINNHPLIRPIVGEPVQTNPVQIIADCQDNTDTTGFFLRRGGDSICNGYYEVAEGSSQYVYIYPAGGHSVIKEVYLNGNLLRVYDDATDEGELTAESYNVVDDEESENPWVYLEREYYVYYINEVAAGTPYVFTAKTEWKPWLVGIDPVAPEVSLGLAPNPASSTVKLKISGVSGMVNCNVIDMSGRIVYNANIDAEGENVINVSSLPAGAYFVRITNDTFSKIEKLIIR